MGRGFGWVPHRPVVSGFSGGGRRPRHDIMDIFQPDEEEDAQAHRSRPSEEHRRPMTNTGSSMSAEGQWSGSVSKAVVREKRSRAAVK